MKNKGFTLIELLVVIAIIGILSSVVVVSLNGARLKSRDSRRVADLRSIRTALDMYFDSNGSYPPLLDPLSVGGKYLASIPVPPNANATVPEKYQYAVSSDGLSYHLGATLESTDNPVLKTDRDCDSNTAGGTTGCWSTAAPANGFSGVPSTAGIDPVYDVTP